MSTGEPHGAAGLGDVSTPTAVGLVVALLGLPTVSALDGTVVEPTPAGSLALQWIPLVLVVGIALLWERRPLRSLGVRSPEPADAGYAALAGVLGFLALAATAPLVAALGLEQSGQAGLGVETVGVGVALAGAVTVAVVEETLFRGYAIERLLEYTDSGLVAGGASWLVFTVAHAASWQTGDLLQVALAALVFTAVYLRRRSLVPVVAAHALIWLLGILGAMYG